MRLPLTFRIFLVLFLLVFVAVATAVWVTIWQGQRIGQLQVERDLANIAAARRQLEDQSFEALQLRTSLIATDPAVAQYLNAVTSDDLGLDGAMPVSSEDPLGLAPAPAAALPTGTRGSIADLLRERQSQYGFDLGIVMDPEGQVLARTDQQDEFVDTLSGDPLVGRVLDSLESTAAYWESGGELYQATAAPIVLQDQSVGLLLLAHRIDDSLAKDLTDISGARVSFWRVEGAALKPGASSLEREQRAELASQLNVQATALMGRMAGAKALRQERIELGGQTWIGDVHPLVGGDEQVVGAVLTLARPERSTGPVHEMQRWVIGTGIVTLVLALGAAYALARGLLKPVRRLAAAARQAANGDYAVEVGVAGTDELSQLSQSFDQLLSSLREKSDMEGYVAELSRFLPEVGGESVAPAVPRATPPTRVRGLLIALDFRRFAQDVPIGQEAIALTELASLAMDAETLARHRGGRLLECQGHTLILGFEGAQRILAGFNVLGHLLIRAAAVTGAAAPAGAALEGEVVHGSLPNREPQSATLGIAMTQVRRLLAEATPGVVLLAPILARTLQPHLGKECGVSVGALSGKNFYALTPTDLSLLPALPDPEGMADDPNATRLPPVTTGARLTPGTARTRLAPGMRLGGRFEILGVLGAGGMGVVYKARDVELDDLVALKMFKPGMQIDAGQLDRLKVELKLARKITHPNVLRTYDFGDVDGTAFISMEYVRGMTLRFLLTQTGRLPYAAALRLARQVCSGLQAAHEVGVLHRDIKPENVILTPQGNAKLMDFGIARPLRKGEIQSGDDGMFVGTPAYAAPEALSGDEVDVRADVYAMGVMLTEMFCGKLPYAGGDTLQIYVQHLEQAPIKPSELWPEVPPALEALLLRCLEKKPALRFPTASALIDALATLRS